MIEDKLVYFSKSYDADYFPVDTQINKEDIDKIVEDMVQTLAFMKSMKIITPLQQKNIRTNVKSWAFDSMKKLNGTQ